MKARIPLCSLLGLRPAANYDTTWERIARAVCDHVPDSRRPHVLFSNSEASWSFPSTTLQQKYLTFRPKIAAGCLSY